MLSVSVDEKCVPEMIRALCICRIVELYLMAFFLCSYTLYKKIKQEELQCLIVLSFEGISSNHVVVTTILIVIQQIHFATKYSTEEHNKAPTPIRNRDTQIYRTNYSYKTPHPSPPTERVS